MHSEKKEKNDSIFFNFAIILTQLISYLYWVVKKAQNDNETRGRSPPLVEPLNTNKSQQEKAPNRFPCSPEFSYVKFNGINAHWVPCTPDY